MNRPLTFKLKIVIWLSFFGLFLLSLFITEKYSQSFHFVDEDEHFVVGSYLNQGYRLYTDLSANHQPLTYITSALTQKVLQPKTLFTLFKAGREAILLWSILGGVWLILQYGAIALPFILFFELTKVFLFGNLFLSESLVIYPLVAIVGECYRLIFTSYQPKKWQIVSFGLANFLAIFNLLPLIVALLFLDLIYIIKIKQKRLFIFSLIVPIGLLFVFINPLDYFRETIYYNWKYTLPFLSPQTENFKFLRFLIFPFLSFFVSKNSILNQWIILFSLVFISNLFVLIINNKNRFLIWHLTFYLLITLINNRNLVPGEMFYSGFHLLPWYAVFILFNLLNLQLIFNNKLKFKYLSLVILSVGSIYLMISPHMPYFEKIDKLKEHNTNFLSYYLIEKGIKILAKEGDRIMVLPDETLVYWNSGVRPATKQIIYHSWEYGVPLLKTEMDKVLANNPPEFIYANFDRIGRADYRPVIVPILKTKYWQVTVNGVAQNIHIRRTKIKSISEDQWQEWTKLSFDRINL